jgi:hypothetical protein
VSLSLCGKENRNFSPAPFLALKIFDPGFFCAIIQLKTMRKGEGKIISCEPKSADDSNQETESWGLFVESAWIAVENKSKKRRRLNYENKKQR